MFEGAIGLRNVLCSRTAQPWGVTMSSIFFQYSIRTKLIAGFGLVLIVTVSLGLFTMQRMANMNSAAEEIRITYLPSLVAINDLTNSVQRLRIKENRYILSTDPAERRAGEKEMADLSAAFARERKSFDALMDKGEETEQFRQINSLWAQYWPLHERMMAAATGNDAAKATGILRSEMTKPFAELTDLLDKEIDYNRDAASKIADGGAELYRQTWNAAAVVVGLATLATLVVGFGLARGISVPLARMTAAMRALAGGDKTVEIPGVGRKDEIGQMADTVAVFKNNMIEADRLREETERLKGEAEAERSGHAAARRQVRGRHQGRSRLGRLAGHGDAVLRAGDDADRRAGDAAGNRGRRLARKPRPTCRPSRHRPRNCRRRCARSASRWSIPRRSPAKRSSRRTRPTTVEGLPRRRSGSATWCS